MKDNEEVMDIDYETDIHCFRLMPHGKSLLEVAGTCNGCRFDPERCVINIKLNSERK